MKKAVITLILTLAALFCLTACTRKTEISRIKLMEYSEINIGETIDIVPVYEAEDADAEEVAKAGQNLTLIWASSDETVATIDNGKVTGVSFGEAIISLSIEDKSLTAETVIKVNSPVEAVIAEDIDIKVRDSEIDIEYDLLPEGVEADVSFNIADETVAKVTNGKITAVKPGETELIIRADDKEKVVNVTVKDENKEPVKTTETKTSANNSSTNVTPANPAPVVNPKPIPTSEPTPNPIPSTPTPAPIIPTPTPKPPVSIPDAPLDNNQNVGDTHNPGYSPADKPIIED